MRRAGHACPRLDGDAGPRQALGLAVIVGYSRSSQIHLQRKQNKYNSGLDDGVLNLFLSSQALASEDGLDVRYYVLGHIVQTSEIQ